MDEDPDKVVVNQNMDPAPEANLEDQQKESLNENASGSLENESGTKYECYNQQSTEKETVSLETESSRDIETTSYFYMSDDNKKIINTQIGAGDNIPSINIDNTDLIDKANIPEMNDDIKFSNNEQFESIYLEQEDNHTEQSTDTISDPQSQRQTDTGGQSPLCRTPDLNLDNIQSEVMSAINETSGFLDSDTPSISSDPPSFAENNTSPVSSPSKTSNGSKSNSVTNSTESLTYVTTTSECSTPSENNSAHTQELSEDKSHTLLTTPTQIIEHSLNDDQLLSELDEALHNNPNTAKGPNGLRILLDDIPDFVDLKKKFETLQKSALQHEENFHRLQKELASSREVRAEIERERDSLRKQLDRLQGENQDGVYEAQIKELEVTIATQSRELRQLKDKLASHDAAARKTVASLQNELRQKVEQLTKMYEDCRREKDNMVMRYAQAEQKNIELQQRQEKMDAKMKEMLKDKDFVISKFKMLKADREKAIQAFDARNGELNSLRKEMEKLKDAYSSSDVKIKWAQNKLKAETTAHQEAKAKLDEANKKLKEAREESEQIRRDCQSMIKNYKDAEEAKTTDLKQQQQERADNEQVHSIVLKELETLKNKHKDMISELHTWRDKVRCLDTERQHQEETLSRFKETLQSQKLDNEKMRARLNELEDINDRLEQIKAQCLKLEGENEEVRQLNKDIENDMQGCAKREAENLIFTQKISDQNAKLKSEKSALENKVIGLTAENERLTTLCQQLEEKVKTLGDQLAEEKRLRSDETEGLTSKLQEKSKAVEQLMLRIDEAMDETRTLKRKHTANIKDLTRQLQQAKRRLESMEGKESGATGSMGSRTSSNNSLDTLGQGNNGAAASHLPAQQEEISSPQEEEYPTVRVVEVDKQVLIEKIVKLQKAHARKNEKMEFMEDHINQLLEEIRRKTKLIQMYALREETGALAPETVDQNKAQMARRQGIMASLYSSHPQDHAIDLPLSLEINHKLQAVLEDTLLKNITLKDNLETLGTEIARLSKENRDLQLKM